MRKKLIEFKNVSFRYGEEQPWVLKDCSVLKSIKMNGLRLSVIMVPVNRPSQNYEWIIVSSTR